MLTGRWAGVFLAVASVACNGNDSERGSNGPDADAGTTILASEEADMSEAAGTWSNFNFDSDEEKKPNILLTRALFPVLEPEDNELATPLAYYMRIVEKDDGVWAAIAGGLVIAVITVVALLVCGPCVLAVLGLEAAGAGVIGVGGVILAGVWATAMLSDEDDTLGQRAWGGTFLDLADRVALTHDPTYLESWRDGTAPLGTLERLPEGPNSRVKAEVLLHPTVDAHVYNFNDDALENLCADDIDCDFSDFCHFGACADDSWAPGRTVVPNDDPPPDFIPNGFLEQWLFEKSNSWGYRIYLLYDASIREP